VSRTPEHDCSSAIRYAQCWEDADVLVEALAIGPGDRCLAIASAGDNVLAMLANGPARVLAVDSSAAQVACLELRVAAYRALAHAELLELVGSRPSARRPSLYVKCREHLSEFARRFWDHRPAEIAAGIGGAGRFERYLKLFRTRVLPLAHGADRVARLLERRSKAERLAFYEREWNTWRWRLLFRAFFSRFVMGRSGRDPSSFAYVDGDVAEPILRRTRYALTELDPADNPYIQWILTGGHQSALPLALRPESFDRIRQSLDRLEWRVASLEEILDSVPIESFDKYNLSDMFEYISPHDYERLLAAIVRAGRCGGRLAYWNLLAPRRRPPRLADRLRPLDDLASRLHAVDKAFFYRAFVVEEIQR
jgi:S-adenosylmethionine-diacylglycerol 3-amino-3-carboxypropyl transferase